MVVMVLVAASASGCSLGARDASGTGGSWVQHPRGDGVVAGRVFTRACGGPAASSCSLTAYRGSLAFCPSMDTIGPCPSARVDGRGRYRISLRPGWHALIPAPGNGNVVFVEPRGVLVRSGRTTTVNIDGGNRMR
jgi:hypothetical protein